MDYGVYNTVLQCNNQIGTSALLQFKYAFSDFYFEIN